MIGAPTPSAVGVGYNPTHADERCTQSKRAEDLSPPPYSARQGGERGVPKKRAPPQAGIMKTFCHKKARKGGKTPRGPQLSPRAVSPPNASLGGNDPHFPRGSRRNPVPHECPVHAPLGPRVKALGGETSECTPPHWQKGESSNEVLNAIPGKKLGFNQDCITPAVSPQCNSLAALEKSPPQFPRVMGRIECSPGFLKEVNPSSTPVSGKSVESELDHRQVSVSPNHLP